MTIDGTVNGINFIKFLENVVTLSTDQIVGGQKIFTGHLHFEDIWLQFLNDIDFTPYAESVINRTKDTLVLGKKTVDG